MADEIKRGAGTSQAPEPEMADKVRSAVASHSFDDVLRLLQRGL